MYLKNLLLIYILVLSISCDEKDAQNLPPVIVMIEPNAGFEGDSLTITGSNFDMAPEKNFVKIVDKLAVVLSVTPTKLVIRVPDSQTGAVSVTTPHGWVIGPTFTYKTAPSVAVEQATHINFNKATLHGVLEVVGSDPVLDHGFIFSENEITNSNRGEKLSLGPIESERKFSSDLMNLNLGTKYHVKTYASTKDTTVVSSRVILFETLDYERWIKIYDLPFRYENPVFESDGFGFNGQPYLGFGADISDNKSYIPIFRFDPLGYEWTELAKFPGLFRFGFFRFMVGQTIYMGSSSSDLTDFWKFEPEKNTWTELQSLPTTLDQYSFVSGDDGFVLELQERKLWRYNTGTGNWSIASSLPGFWGRMLTFSINDRCYVLPFSTPSLWEYVPATNSWIQRKKPPFDPQIGSFAVATSSRAHLLLRSNGGAIKHHTTYDPISDTYSELVQVPVEVHGVAAVGNRLYGANKSEVFVYIER